MAASERLVSQTPSGVSIRETGAFGLGLFATKPFKKGTIIYESSCLLTERNEVPDIDYEHFCVYDVERGKYQVYGFDRYMNHSCEPTCVTTDPTYVDGSLKYKMVMLRDIEPGEQLFEDYFNFEYDEMKIVDCRCGASSCRKTINGFKNLPLTEKLRRVNLCEASLIEQWAKDDPNVRLAELPSERRQEFTGASGFFRQEFSEHDLSAESGRRPTAEEPTLLFKVNGRYVWSKTAR